DARGAILGLTRGSTSAQIVRAGLESVAYSCADLLGAMAADGVDLATMKVDGGMSRNDWLMHFLAGIINMPVERPAITETTAFGAAALAGIGARLYDGLGDIARIWKREAHFAPDMDDAVRTALLDGWRSALARVRTR
ncbi:MAG TPA: glycerol kinase, partial [Rhodobacteraceae bacterium]|nr:glycerol kinase [Paracoccaceae bacterium]